MTPSEYEQRIREQAEEIGRLREENRQLRISGKTLHGQIIELREVVSALREDRERLSTLEQVRDFHARFVVPILAHPAIPSIDRVELREKLIREEYEEFVQASENGDLVEIRCTAERMARCSSRLHTRPPMWPVSWKPHAPKKEVEE